jgi:CBS domain containing-hemolysin-like protein
LAIARIFRPFIVILNQSTRLLLRIGGIEYTGQGWYKQVTPEELQLIIATERESVGLEAEERKLLNNIFEFAEITAVEVMVPRTSIKFLPITATFADLLAQISLTGHFRYPIIGDSLDDIRGIIDYKDLVFPLNPEKLTNKTAIEPWVKPVRFFPESTPLSELLPVMQRKQMKMAIVVDEFGGTSGLVTFEDTIAEIIGDGEEIRETEEVSLEMVDEHTYLVSAQMNLEEVNELLNLDLPLAEEYQTLGGFLLFQWQKIPTQGESLDYQNLKFTVTVVDANRIELVSIERQELNSTEEKDSIYIENNRDNRTGDRGTIA